jgi:hypothetical protein
MKTHSAQNERIKRAYFIYLAEAQGFSESTLDAVAKALNRFETYTKFRDFKAFHIEQAQGFKANLAERDHRCHRLVRPYLDHRHERIERNGDSLSILPAEKQQ